MFKESSYINTLENNRIITGDDERQSFKKRRNYTIGKYNIVVLLSEDGHFAGIEEIQVEKDFLSHKQRFSNLGYHDVDDLYQD